jgi:serine/threonine protein kinase
MCQSLWDFERCFSSCSPFLLVSFRAPEIIRQAEYDERCDVYSFGIVAWELLMRQRPWIGRSVTDIQEAVPLSGSPETPLLTGVVCRWWLVSGPHCLRRCRSGKCISLHGVGLLTLWIACRSVRSWHFCGRHLLSRLGRTRCEQKKRE